MLEQTVDVELRNLINLINSKYISTSTEFRPLDLARTAQYFSQDTISHLAFGKAFGGLTQDRDVHDLINSTGKFMPILNMLGVFPSVVALLQSALSYKLLPSAQDSAGLGKVFG